MRIALIPLDSRPANWQFPQRLADIAGIELLLPPRVLLGTLQDGAASLALAQWLADCAPRCQAAVISWDALLHGGLVQSRKPSLDEQRVTNLVHILERIDWSATAGYGYLTIPRLGVTIDTASAQASHQLIRDYLIACGDADTPPAPSPALALAEQIGRYALARVWEWRKLNHAAAQYVQLLSSRIGLRHLHFAKEDNAPSGPHLREEQALRERYTSLLRDDSALRCSFFDGADECACLLLAKAWADGTQAAPLPVRLRVHPATPGPERYTGLYESHTLADGLDFAGKLLGLQYTSNPSAGQWLVTYGLQPQPDVYAADPRRVFDNPYLLPAEPLTGGPVFCADLAACNGANPHLAAWLAAQPAPLAGLVGFNTNFNTLGVCAAWLRLAGANPLAAPSRRFALERLADDVCYQSLARPQVLELARAQGVNPLDFGTARPEFTAAARVLADNAWRDWVSGPGAPCLAQLGIPPESAQAVACEYPWRRAFEIEASAPG
jgi:hypothetical protein